MTTRILLATGNVKKLVELRDVLHAARLDVEVLGLDDVRDGPEPVESARTFEGNALIKAREWSRRTGLPALADDSGITVGALNGSPGVRSARWAGPECDDEANLNLLIHQISDVPEGHRDAAFVCAMALALPDGSEHVVVREWPGHVALERRGSNGFGYDPIFVPAGHHRTSAELSPAEKNAISHRGQAVRAMVPVLVQTLGLTPVGEETD